MSFETLSNNLGGVGELHARLEKYISFSKSEADTAGEEALAKRLGTFLDTPSSQRFNGSFTNVFSFATPEHPLFIGRFLTENYFDDGSGKLIQLSLRNDRGGAVRKTLDYGPTWYSGGPMTRSFALSEKVVDGVYTQPTIINGNTEETHHVFIDTVVSQIPVTYASFTNALDKTPTTAAVTPSAVSFPLFENIKIPMKEVLAWRQGRHIGPDDAYLVFQDDKTLHEYMDKSLDYTAESRSNLQERLLTLLDPVTGDGFDMVIGIRTEGDTLVVNAELIRRKRQ